jgi:hypothetical protein
VRPEPSSPRSPLHFALHRRALAHRSGRRPSSGERAVVPSVRAGVGPRWTEHSRPVHGDVDPVHGINRRKIIHYSDYSEILQRGTWTFVKSTRGPDFTDLALRPLGFFEINPWSTIFAVRSKIRKIFTKRSLASEKSTKIAPKFKNSYLFNHNSKSSDSSAKILRIASSFYAFM